MPHNFLTLLGKIIYPYEKEFYFNFNRYTGIMVPYVFSQRLSVSSRANSFFLQGCLAMGQQQAIFKNI